MVYNIFGSTACCLFCLGARKATTLAPGADMPLVCSEKYANQTPTHTMCLTDHPNATEVHLSEEVKQQIVDHHNRLRANVDPAPANMQKMVNLLHSLLLLHMY